MGVPGAIPLCFSLMTMTMGGGGSTNSGSRPAKPGPDNTWHYAHVLRMDDSIRRIAGQVSVHLAPVDGDDDVGARNMR